MDISNNAKKARPSSTLSISSNANRMIDEGIDIVNLVQVNRILIHLIILKRLQ